MTAASWNEVKEQVKDRVDLASIVARDTKLVKSSNGFKGCCPLPGHSEKTPSFHVNTRDNFFYCFGCQRGGDVFRYLEITQGKPFVEAVRELAEEFHIELPKSAVKEIDNKAKDRRDQAFEILERTCKFFEENLHQGTSAGAKDALEYLKKRGYSTELARRFRLGWAPETGTAIAKKLAEKKLSSLGEALGLLSRGRLRDDFFRARLMIPIDAFLQLLCQRQNSFFNFGVGQIFSVIDFFFSNRIPDISNRSQTFGFFVFHSRRHGFFNFVLE